MLNPQFNKMFIALMVSNVYLLAMDPRHSKDETIIIRFIEEDLYTTMFRNYYANKLKTPEGREAFEQQRKREQQGYAQHRKLLQIHDIGDRLHAVMEQLNLTQTRE